jgi:hypothetical protein
MYTVTQCNYPKNLLFIFKCFHLQRPADKVNIALHMLVTQFHLYGNLRFVGPVLWPLQANSHGVYGEYVPRTEVFCTFVLPYQHNSNNVLSSHSFFYDQCYIKISLWTAYALANYGRFWTACSGLFPANTNLSNYASDQKLPCDLNLSAKGSNSCPLLCTSFSDDVGMFSYRSVILYVDWSHLLQPKG